MQVGTGVRTRTLKSEAAERNQRNYGTGMLKLWYTMAVWHTYTHVHVHKTYARCEIQINIYSNTSNFNIFYK